MVLLQPRLRSASIFLLLGNLSPALKLFNLTQLHYRDVNSIVLYISFHTDVYAASTLANLLNKAQL